MVDKSLIKPLANLRWADLRGADLRGADLRGADLREANLYGADLREANLYGANLREANLYGANLRGANLYGANLREANFQWADLREANFQWADLREANLYGADLRGADLRWANLRWADLTNTKLPHFQIPQEGELVVYKKLRYGVICKLRVPPEAKRTASLVGRKCRAQFVEVIEGSGFSRRDGTTQYLVGQIVRPSNGYDDDIRVECTSGIHFFLTREEAEEY